MKFYQQKKEMNFIDVWIGDPKKTAHSRYYQ